MNKPYRLYLVTNRDCLQTLNLTDVVQMAVQSGVGCVQLREKNCSTREYVELARELKAILTRYSVPLFINDRLDVALAVNADGLHLGNSDMKFKDARALLPSHINIGLTITSLSDIETINQYPLAYLGVSALYKSSVKSDIEHYWTSHELSQLKQSSHHLLVGIGGVNVSNVNDVLTHGLDGIAVSSAICAQPSLSLVKQETEKFVLRLKTHREALSF